MSPIPENTILQGDALARLKELPDGCVHCCITSPPFWGLRDYGTGTWEGGDGACQHVVGGQVQDNKNPGAITRGQRPGVDASVCKLCGAKRTDQQIGLERTPQEYVSKLVGIFREVRRVLRDDGTVWLNLGDSYAAYWGDKYAHKPFGEDRTPDASTPPDKETPDWWSMGLKPKDLVGMPWRVAFALQADGWWLRMDNVWSKPNPMPSSARDRPTMSHEYVFLLSKCSRYFYDAEAIKEPLAGASVARIAQAIFDAQTGGPKDYAHGTNPNKSSRRALANLKARIIPPQIEDDPERWSKLTGRNKRSVWHIASRPFTDELCSACGRYYARMPHEKRCRCGRKDAWVSHYAVFPEDLVATCLLAGTSERGCCASCGAPMRRVIETPKPPRELLEKPVPASERDGGLTAEDGLERVGMYHSKYAEWLAEHPPCTAAWVPTCGCGGGGLEPDDLEVIESPLGSVQAPDPSLETGRSGFDRPRSEDEGTSTMTRWEQRDIARQLRESPHRAAMEGEAGTEAFAHYLRTDRSGARPVPAGLLERWTALYGVRRNVPPVGVPPLVPCIVLDPFMGSGTTALVALKAGRRFIGIELNPDYARLAEERIRHEKSQARLF